MRSVILAACVLFLIAGCGGGSNSAGGGLVPIATPVTPAAYQGHWTGQWMNQTFNTTGGLTLDIAVNTAASTVAITETLTGNVLGGTAPPPETINGTYTNAGITLTAQSATFGALNFTIGPTGNISGSTTNLPNPNIRRLDVTGTSNGSTMTINYVITFTAGNTAHGVVNLTKQAAPA